MNQKIVKELLRQLQQENQDPQDIGKLNIANIIIWMKKEAYEPTTIQRVVKELKAFRTKLQHNKTPRSKTIHSQQKRIKRKKRKPHRILQHRNPILRINME